MTEHGGIVIEGIPGVSISGGVAKQAGSFWKPEPQIFNLQWRKEDKITKYGAIEEMVILSADTTGYDDGEEVTITLYEDGKDESIDEVIGTVKDDRVEVCWSPESNKEKE